MSESHKIKQTFEKMKRDNPFQVPEGYFEHFSEKLNNRIHEEKQDTVQSERMFIWKPYLAAAITILVAMAAGSYAYFSQSESRAAKRLHAEITQVVDRELYSISEETILEVMEAESAPLATEQPVREDEVIDYLMNEDIHEDELLNAL